MTRLFDQYQPWSWEILPCQYSLYRQYTSTQKRTSVYKSLITEETTSYSRLPLHAFKNVGVEDMVLPARLIFHTRPASWMPRGQFWNPVAFWALVVLLWFWCCCMFSAFHLQSLIVLFMSNEGAVDQQSRRDCSTSVLHLPPLQHSLTIASSKMIISSVDELLSTSSGF